MTLLGRERELRVLIGIASNWRDGREQTPNLDRRVAAARSFLHRLQNFPGQVVGLLSIQKGAIASKEAIRVE